VEVEYDGTAFTIAHPDPAAARELAADRLFQLGVEPWEVTRATEQGGADSTAAVRQRLRERKGRRERFRVTVVGGMIERAVDRVLRAVAER
jgi:hypothetical protein